MGSQLYPCMQNLTTGTLCTRSTTGDQHIVFLFFCMYNYSIYAWLYFDCPVCTSTDDVSFTQVHCQCKVMKSYIQRLSVTVILSVMSVGELKFHTANVPSYRHKHTHTTVMIQTTTPLVIFIFFCCFIISVFSVFLLFVFLALWLFFFIRYCIALYLLFCTIIFDNHTSISVDKYEIECYKFVSIVSTLEINFNYGMMIT